MTKAKDQEPRANKGRIDRSDFRWQLDVCCHGCGGAGADEGGDAVVGAKGDGGPGADEFGLDELEAEARTMAATMRMSSSMANVLPMQPRGPPPKGK